ncbi:MAG: hypothetical protein R2684_06975 [Pyrinomonadaceae bacterium]
MKKKNLLALGRGGSLFNGLAALFIISLIVLGCTCNEKDGFKFGKKDSDTTENRSDDVADKDTDKKKDSDEDYPFDADEDEVPSDAQLQGLVRHTLNDFNDAVKDGDFTDFHSKVANVWKRSSKPSDFNKGFSEFIDKKINIDRIEGETAEFSPDPRIGKKSGKKVLFVKGKYDTNPLPVNFELEYLVDGGEWKLIFIGVDTRK